MGLWKSLKSSFRTNSRFGHGCKNICWPFVLDILDDEGIMSFEDIMLFDAGGVGWGEVSGVVTEKFLFVESLTPLGYLTSSWVSTGINWDPYIT